MLRAVEYDPRQVEVTVAGVGEGPVVLNDWEPTTTMLGLVQLPAGVEVGTRVGDLDG